MKKCLACEQAMTEEEWYPEMLCESCKQDIDMAFMNGNIQEGMETPNEY